MENFPGIRNNACYVFLYFSTHIVQRLMNVACTQQLMVYPICIGGGGGHIGKGGPKKGPQEKFKPYNKIHLNKIFDRQETIVIELRNRGKENKKKN